MPCDIQIFNHSEFGEVRTAISENGEPLFCLVDLCKVLNLSSTEVNRRLEKEVVSKHPLETSGGTQQALFVNEDGLYDVILESRKPEARRFRKWVTSEILPSIRKSGEYHLLESIGGVLPLIYNGKAGYPRKELLIACGYSPRSGADTKRAVIFH
jgi:prophage antirepressor-like protein